MLFITDVVYAQLEPLWTMNNVRLHEDLQNVRVYDNTLVANQNGYLTAWNAQTGETLWKSESRIEWFEIRQDTIIGIDASTRDLTALDINTGNIIWMTSLQFLVRQREGSPPFKEPVFYKWRFYKDTIVILPNGGSRIAIFDLFTGKLIWLGWPEDAGFHYHRFYYSEPLFTIYNKRWGARSPGGFYIFDVSQRAIIFDRQQQEIKMTSDHIVTVDNKTLRFSTDNTVGEIDVVKSKVPSDELFDCTILECASSYTQYSVDGDAATLLWSTRLPFSLWKDGFEVDSEAGSSMSNGYIQTDLIAWYADNLWILDAESKNLYQFSPSQNVWSHSFLSMCDDNIMFVTSLPSVFRSEETNGYLLCEVGDTNTIYSLSKHTFTTFPSKFFPFSNLDYLDDDITVFTERQKMDGPSKLSFYDSRTATLKMSIESGIITDWVVIDDILIAGFNHAGTPSIQAFDLTQ